MVLRFFLLAMATAFLFMSSCADGRRDNPCDYDSPDYDRNQCYPSTPSFAFPYCVYTEPELCYYGSYYYCPGDGWLSNYCPYLYGSSSSSRLGSSSSGKASSSSSAREYDYCVFDEDETCLEGPASVCPPGGRLSDYCFYDIYEPSSSSSSKPSSSSEYTGGSCNISDYGTVTIGTQTWMKKNWGCYAPGSVCHSNLESNCAKYGRLYDWATAMNLPTSCNYNFCASQVNAEHMGICPAGWHLPSYAEWTTLVNYVGGEEIAGKKLKATSGWDGGGNGTDDYGFAALPGGWGGYINYYNVGYVSYWWGATERGNSTSATSIDMDPDEFVYFGGSDKNYLLSVRCVKDNGNTSLPSSSSKPSSSSAAVSSSSSKPSSSSSVPSSSSKPSSSSSAPPSSSSISYVLACGSVPSSGSHGGSVTPPTVTCNGTTVSSGLNWNNAPNWSSLVGGNTYSNVSVSASSGNCSGKTATCSGTLTVASVLACGSVPASGNISIALTAPAVTCNGTAITSGLTWNNAPVWANPSAGTYSNVSVSASSGDCRGKTATCNGTLTVKAEFSYEGETYKTVVIGTQTWMAKNLKYNVSGSVCQDGYCTTDYGRSYNWAMAMNLPASCNSNSSCALQISSKHRGICPSGWHIPTSAEWKTLADFVGGEEIAGKKLKATSGWNNNGNGTDNYEFAALPAGYYLGGSWEDKGIGSNWWSATDGVTGIGGDLALHARVTRTDGFDPFEWRSKSYFISIRCVRD